MLTISTTTPTFLSTESPRHKSFPLSSHPTDALCEALHILRTVEPLATGEFCSGRKLMFNSPLSTDAYLSLVHNLTNFCQE